MKCSSIIQTLFQLFWLECSPFQPSKFWASPKQALCDNFPFIHVNVYLIPNMYLSLLILLLLILLLLLLLALPCMMRETSDYFVLIDNVADTATHNSNACWCCCRHVSIHSQNIKMSQHDTCINGHIHFKLPPTCTTFTHWR